VKTVKYGQNKKKSLPFPLIPIAFGLLQKGYQG
jgi:hypothetical protein